MRELPRLAVSFPNCAHTRISNFIFTKCVVKSIGLVKWVVGAGGVEC